MEPLTIDRTHILVLNYNGRGWLEECLPTILEAAERSPVPCPVTVVDNDSTDGSCEWLAGRWPAVGLIREREPRARLVQPRAGATGRARRPAPEQRHQARPGCGRPPAPGRSSDHDDALFSAPLCWTFDGRTYEGMRTRVRMRFGLVQGMCRVPGFEQAVDKADLTAAAGPVLAVDRRRFLGSADTTRSTSPAGSRTSTWDSAAGWPAIGAITCPSRSPITGDSARSSPSWA